jgi:hypothetical protein
VQSRLLLSFVTLASLAGCSKPPPKSAGAEGLDIPIERGPSAVEPGSRTNVTGEPSGAPVVNYPAFEVLRDGTSLVTVQVRGPVQVTEQKVEGRIVYSFQGVAVPEKVNRLPLATQHFPTQVTSVMLEQTPSGANVVIDLREPATSTFSTRRNEAGTLVSIVVPRSQKYGAEAKVDPQSPSTSTETDTTYVDNGPPAGAEPRGKRRTSEVRFRGGVALEGGLFIVPQLRSRDPEQTFGTLGVHGDIGVQFNDVIGLYWAPGFDAVLGPLYGAVIASAILIDFTGSDVFSVGFGPDVGYILAGGGDASEEDAEITAIAGVQGGGRIRLAIHPLVARGDDEIRRKALTFGADVRILAGPIVQGVAGSDFASLNFDSSFGVQPQLFLGYTAF